ncbi:hypothetical protein [Terribacillus sp. AE2B 122]|nr:hypothetical protein [Terribacillus sp. AE2B 122]
MGSAVIVVIREDAIDPAVSPVVGFENVPHGISMFESFLIIKNR